MLIYRILTALTISVCFFSFAGCVSHGQEKQSVDNTIPKIFTNSVHHTVQQGIANTITISAKTTQNYWNKDTQFSLIPAGPYISHSQPLDFHPLAIVSDGKFAYVATGSSQKTHSNLLIFHFTNDGQSKIISKKLSIKGVITKLSYKNKQLIFALKHGGMKTVDVSNPALPVIIHSYSTKSPIQDIHYGKQTIYLLLKDNTLLEVNYSSRSMGNQFSKLLHEWILPVPAKSIAIRNRLIYLAGSNGVAIVKLTGTTAKLVHLYKTSGTPLSIKLLGNLAVIADGPGGLVVLRINNNEQLQWLGSYNKQGAINFLSVPISTKDITNKKIVMASTSNGNIMSIDLSNPELPGNGVIFKPEQPILAATPFNAPNGSLSVPPNNSLGKNLHQSSVLIATKNSLMRVIMNGNNKQLISSVGLNQGGSRRGVIRDNILYVADWFSGLHLYDISNPIQIRHLSNYHTPGSSKGIALLDDYAVIGDDDQGLQIINIRNPLHPQWVSELTPASLSGVGLAYTMKLVNNTLYLADHRGGFHIIDLTDIEHPKRLGGYNTSGKSWGIDVVKNLVFVADDTSGLLIFDADNVTKPELVGLFNPGGQAEDVLVKDNLAYVTFFDKGLYILDIRQPQKPKVVGHISIPGNARGLALDNSHLDKPLAYIAGWESGLHIVDISNPETPQILGSYDTDGAAWGVNIKNGVAYVLDWWGGIKAVDARQPAKPVYLSQYHARDTLQQLRSKNKYLFAASGSGGLQIFDIKNSLNPIWATGVDFNGSALDVWIEEDRAYVAAGKNGIVILDTLDPFYTQRIGHVSTPGKSLRVIAWNEILYIQDSLAGLMVVDVRDLQQPRELGRYPIQFNDLWVDENALWVSTEQGLTWWEHNENGALVNKRENKNLLTIAGGINRVRSQDDLVVTTDKNGVVKLWRKTPQGLTPLSQYKTHESLSDLQLVKDSIYVLGERSGLLAININDLKTPRIAATYPATGKHTRFVITQSQNQSAAFFAGEARLASVRLLPSTGLTSTFLPLTGTSHQDSTNKFKIHLPTDLPIGLYHLLADTPGGHKELLPNALSVQFSSPDQGKSSLKAMRQMLKNPLKPPTEP